MTTPQRGFRWAHAPRFNVTRAKARVSVAQNPFV